MWDDRSMSENQTNVLRRDTGSQPAISRVVSLTFSPGFD
jgi:hypothetical protein